MHNNKICHLGGTSCTYKFVSQYKFVYENLRKNIAKAFLFSVLLERYTVSRTSAMNYSRCIDKIQLFKIKSANWTYKDMCFEAICLAVVQCL